MAPLPGHSSIAVAGYRKTVEGGGGGGPCVSGRFIIIFARSPARVLLLIAHNGVCNIRGMKEKNGKERAWQQQQECKRSRSVVAVQCRNLLLMMMATTMMMMIIFQPKAPFMPPKHIYTHTYGDNQPQVLDEDGALVLFSFCLKKSFSFVVGDSLLDVDVGGWRRPRNE